jgi:hypothetical protein
MYGGPARQRGDAHGLRGSEHALPPPAADRRVVVDHPLVTDRLPRYEPFTQAADGRDDHFVAGPGQRVRGEGNAGGVGCDHFLHQDGHPLGDAGRPRACLPVGGHARHGRGGKDRSDGLG